MPKDQVRVRIKLLSRLRNTAAAIEVRTPRIERVEASKDAAFFSFAHHGSENSSESVRRGVYSPGHF